MKAEYDLSKMKSRRNPCASKLKESVTIRIGEYVIDYLKGMADETNISYQSLINFYLQDCVAHQREIDMQWEVCPKNAIESDALLLLHLRCRSCQSPSSETYRSARRQK